MKTRRPNRDLKSFLDGCRVEKGVEFSHTSFCPRGRFAITRKKDLDIFFKLYCNAVETEEILCITEMPLKFHPLYIDVDFRFKYKEGKKVKRQYKEKHVESVVSLYQELIRIIVPAEEITERLLSCILFEKSEPRVSDGVIKDGFHLMFPFFVVDSFVQNTYLREKVIAFLVEKESFSDLNLLEPVEKCIDSLKGKAWLMYGSTKPANSDGDFLESYKITRVYGDDLQEVDVENLLEEEADELGLEIPKNLPVILSIQRRREPTQIVQGIVPLEKKRNNRRGRPKLKRTVTEIMEEIKEIKDGRIMEMIADWRVEDYDQWMDVGWTLFNIGNGLEEARDVWIEFSQRSDKFVEGRCELIWETMEMRGKTMGSLLNMAKQDNLDKYNEWKSQRRAKDVDSSIVAAKPTHANLAKVIHTSYSDRFVCADAKSNIWYEFRDHRWNKMDDANEFMRIISFDLPEIYAAEIGRLIAIPGGPQDPNTNLKIKKCADIQMKLQMDGFATGVMRMCKRLFLDMNFLGKLDENRNLLGLEDGVWDLKTGIFRDGSPDDYISMSCGLSYKSFKGNEQELAECYEFLEKIFPNPRIRKCAVRMMSSCLQGGNRNKRIYICTGKGHNGKSVLFSLLEYILAQYIIKFPREMCLVGRSGNPSAARPELARAPGARIAVIQEVHKNEKFNPGILKELSGNDSFFVRSLYEKGRDVKPQFTLMIQCNVVPAVPGSDFATWARVRIIPFESCFYSEDSEEWVEDPEERKKLNIFKADPHFEEKIPKLANALLWILLQDFKEYQKEGLCEPPEVEIATSRLRARNDPFLRFVRDCIVKQEEDEDGEKTSISVMELFKEFKDFFDENYSGYSSKKLTLIGFRKKISKTLKQEPVGGRKFMGIKIKEKEDLEKEEEEEQKEEEMED